MAKQKVNNNQLVVEKKAEKTVDKQKDENEEKLSIFSSPIRTIYYFSIVVARFLKTILKFIVRHSSYFVLVSGMLVSAHMFEGNHTPLVKKFDEIGYFALYWIVLGIASSVGLGTGLHTFVLYTGPHIAKVTMVANECNDIPEYIPSRWTPNPTFGLCKPGDREAISFWTILFITQLEGILWGFGTAIGELPPYFVAKAASVAGKTDEELKSLEKGGADNFIDKIKLLIYRNLKKYGWITILLSASIPNPLFDLAGITCGHFGIPFKTFFSATAIGKALIKAHLQMVFVIFVFSKNHVEHLLAFLEKNIPFLKNTLSSFLDKQKKLLHAPLSTKEAEKPLIAQIWDVVIIVMIVFFLVSIINSLANSCFEEEREKKNNRKNDSQSKPKKVHELTNAEKSAKKEAPKQDAPKNEVPKKEASKAEAPKQANKDLQSKKTNEKADIKANQEKGGNKTNKKATDLDLGSVRRVATEPDQPKSKKNQSKGNSKADTQRKAESDDDDEIEARQSQNSKGKKPYSKRSGNNPFARLANLKNI